MSNHMDRISSLRRIHPIPHGGSNLVRLKEALQQLQDGKMPGVQWSIKTRSIQQKLSGTSKIRIGKRGKSSMLCPLCELNKIVEETLQNNKEYWKAEIKNVVEEFGFDYLTPNLQELYKKLGMMQKEKSNTEE